MGQPEIIPPGTEPKESRLDDASLETLARLLDDVFCIPGTNIRFGVDPLIGLIPGIGDLITGLASFLIIFAGWQRGLPRVTITRMVANVAIDTVVGSIPVVGDVFDAAWKSNRMNLKLLQRESSGPSKKHTILDGLFLLAIAMLVLALLALPFLVIWLIVKAI
jgi:hypothetical protein